MNAVRQYEHECHRRRYLPGQLRAARHKVKALEAEARRYGMKELLTNTEHVDEAWDRAIEDALRDVDFGV
jgi:hypothetical protein